MAEENKDKIDVLEHYPAMNELMTSGNTRQRIMDIYTEEAPVYNKKMALLKYNPPWHCARETAAILGDFKDAKILNIAAGTGLDGVELSKLGYKNLDALDANPAMLAEAKKADLYNRLICAFLGPKKVDDIEEDTYDAVVTAGSFVPGQLGQNCFEEIIRILKPGGHFILVMCKRYLIDKVPEFATLESTMQQHQDNKLWKLIVRKEVPRYIDDLTGLVFAFQKLATEP